MAAAVLPVALAGTVLHSIPETPAAGLPPGACCVIADASELKLELGVAGQTVQAPCQQAADNDCGAKISRNSLI